jgi:prevent-host-death family protein
VSEAGAATSRVGVRELRQNLSVYLRRIHRSGERFEVTDRGRPVALLVPLAGNESPLAKLIAQGRANRPKSDLLELDPPAGEPSTAASEAVIADRDDRL